MPYMSISIHWFLEWKENTYILHWYITSERFFFWFNNNFIFQQYNRHCFTSKATCFSESKRRHPPPWQQPTSCSKVYSAKNRTVQMVSSSTPDLVPSDYHLLRSLHHHLCNKPYEEFNELSWPHCLFRITIG
jgi:hypothetical protein